MDYIKKESRGKAVALQNLGNLLGETFAMSVLFGFSKKESVSQNEAFLMAAITVGVLSLGLLCIVKNREIKAPETIKNAE